MPTKIGVTEIMAFLFNLKKEEVQDKFRSMKIFIETVEGFLDSQ